MAANPLLPKLIPSCCNSIPPHTQFTNLSFLTNPSLDGRRITRLNVKKKNPWLDWFDQGDDPDMEYGALFSDGKQEEDPRPPDNPDNPYGFLKFPPGYAVEVALLGLKIRGDVRRCCCVISGGVYENLLFFPAIQLIKDQYPGVQIDVVTSARGKQAYEINKNVRWANEYDLDDPFPEPAEYTDMIGVIKSGLKPVFVIPHEKERENVEDVVGEDASIVFITTPGQLAALINDSAGVIATNTAAIQLAHAREKPSVALLCSNDKAKVFVPNSEEKNCVIISSKTGKLIDIDVEAAKTAIQIFSMPLAIA